MSSNNDMLEIFVYEASQLIEQLEEVLIEGESSQSLNDEHINSIFRIMHTIKGSSAMMAFDSISTVTHHAEDMFFYIRENNPTNVDWGAVCDLVLMCADFIKGEIVKIQNEQEPNGDSAELSAAIKRLVESFKDGGDGAEQPAVAEEQQQEQKELPDLVFPPTSNSKGTQYVAKIRFDHGCQMENLRAYGIINALENMISNVKHEPEDLMMDEAADDIVSRGFLMFFNSEASENELRERIGETLFLRSLELSVLQPEQQEETTEKSADTNAASAPSQAAAEERQKEVAEKAATTLAAESSGLKQSFISVNVDKLDKLMDLVGEIVITESMVVRNQDLDGLVLENFEKAARQLRKLTDELQDVVMSVRMIPVSSTFHKMMRIVRDMSRKTGKDVELIIRGEETEVDKNIIDNLSDPLMHIIRNSMDHGIEEGSERAKTNKPLKGSIILEAKNTGGDVVITVTDDGRGLDRDKLIKKAQANGLTTKSESEISDKEAYAFIMAAGFSTKDEVTEYSGRGVGMDVVRSNIEKIGGSVSIESVMGKGMTVNIKIPLTLAIVDGMEIQVGESICNIPTLTIKESFKAQQKDIITDPDGNEMIMIRGECYPVVRLHEVFEIEDAITDLQEGIIVMVDCDNKTICLLADRLIGEQQVVVKPIPAYITKRLGRIKGIAGCSILGNGNISLILDINSLAD